MDFDDLYESFVKALQNQTKDMEPSWEDMADDSDELRNAILNMEKHMDEIDKGNKSSSKLSVITLVVAILTLIATVVSILASFFHC